MFSKSLKKEVARFLVCVMMLTNISSVCAGGGMSRPIAAIGLGIATGGVGFALGAPVATATVSGLATTASVMANGRTSVGVEVNGNGGNAGTFVNVSTNQGTPIVDMHVHREDPPIPSVLRSSLPGSSSTFQQNLSTESSLATDLARERLVQEEAKKAQRTFTISNSSISNYTFGIKRINGKEYHFAKSRYSERLVLSARKWRIRSDYGPFSSITHFEAHTEDERLAMRSFIFEETPYIWHFGRENIDGKLYNHAWTDTYLDMLVPENEVHRIIAPSEYTRQRLARLAASRSSVSSSSLSAPVSVDTAFTKAKEAAAQGLLEEASWAAVHSVHAARHDFEDEARRAASTVVEYYNRAVSTFAEFAMDVVTPGGIDNWQKYSRDEIGLPQLEESIRHDMEADLVAGMVGSLLGSVTGGGAAAFVTAGTGTIAGTSIGAEEGAIIGVAVSRSVRSAWNRFEDKKRRSSGQKTGTSRVTDRVTREYKSRNTKTELFDAANHFINNSIIFSWISSVFDEFIRRNILNF